MAQTLGGNRHFERFVKTAQPTTQLPCGPHSAQRARRLGSRAARQRMGSAAAVHSASAARSPALSVWPLCPIPLSRARCLFVFSLLRSSFQQLFTSSPSQLVSRCPSLWPPACLPRSICPRGLAAGPYGRPCTATCARPSTPKSRPASTTHTQGEERGGGPSERERPQAHKKSGCCCALTPSRRSSSRIASAVPKSRFTLAFSRSTSLSKIHWLLGSPSTSGGGGGPSVPGPPGPFGPGV